MSYNVTTLYDSQGTKVSSCTLSESVSNFRIIRFKIADNNYCEIPSFTNGTRICSFNASGKYTSEVYIQKVLAVTIDSAGTVLTVSRHNLIGSGAYKNDSSGARTWGSGINSTGNRTVPIVVEGIDKIDYTDVPGEGKPGVFWKKYQEVELWSGSPSNTITLSESASNFERLKILSGTNSPTWKEVDGPHNDGDQVTLLSLNTESESSFTWGFSLWTWSNNMTVLTSTYGKSFTNSNTSVYTHSETLDTSDTDFNKRSITKIIGINRRS